MNSVPETQTTIREYTIYVRLTVTGDPYDETNDEPNVTRLCDAFDAGGIDGDDWDFGDTRDIEDQEPA